MRFVISQENYIETFYFPGMRMDKDLQRIDPCLSRFLVLCILFYDKFLWTMRKLSMLTKWPTFPAIIFAVLLQVHSQTGSKLYCVIYIFKDGTFSAVDKNS